MSEAAESIGARVCTARKRRGLTQRELAGKAAVSAGWVSMLETGDHVKSFGLTKVMAIAGALNVPLDWLVHGGEEPEWGPPISPSTPTTEPLGEAVPQGTVLPEAG